MLAVIDDILEVVAAIIVLGVVIYIIIDNIVYFKYKEEDHKDEDS